MPPGRYQNQPYKIGFILWQLVSVPTYHFPSWIVSGILMLGEKRRGSWNLKRHLLSCLFRHSLWVSQSLGLMEADKHNHLALGDEPNSNGVWIPAVSAELIVGEVKSRADSFQVSSISIPGYWIHKSNDMLLEAPPLPGEKVLIHLHGGAYTYQTAHPDGPISSIPKGYLKHFPFLRRTFAIEYRLSAGPPFKPVNPFPAALIDTLAGYLHLVNLGFAEKDIIISGDSAGANIALALTRYLVENRELQPRLPAAPGSLILLSPWIDISESFERELDPESSQVRFGKYDWFPTTNAETVAYSSAAFVGGDIKEAFRNPYISPGNRQLLGLTPPYQRTVSFKGFPRSWIQIGGFEVLLDQARRLRDVMVEDMGDSLVRYNEVDGGLHDQLALLLVEQEPDRSDSMQKIGKWLEEDET